VDGRAQVVQAVGLAQVQRDQGGVLAGGLQDRVVQGLERALGAGRGDDVGAGLGQAQGDRLADAARGAGDEGDAAGQRLLGVGSHGRVLEQGRAKRKPAEALKLRHRCSAAFLA
jgi:hypothetical protein